MSKDCPSKRPKFCKQCFAENDHNTIDCKNTKKLDLSDVPDMSEGEAWALITKASDDLEVDDFRETLKILSKANPALTYPAVEKELRKRDLSFFLIGLKKEVAQAYTNVNLQGEVGKTYTLGVFTRSDSCPRPVLMEAWPKDAADNLLRLTDAGVPLSRGVPVCSACNQLGHTRKACKEEVVAPERQTVTCVLCDETVGQQQAQVERS